MSKDYGQILSEAVQRQEKDRIDKINAIAEILVDYGMGRIGAGIAALSIAKELEI